MSEPARLLEIVGAMADDGPFEVVLATTFNFDAEFFVNTGVLPALAGAGRTGAGGPSEQRRRVDSEVVRDILGNPFVGVLQGCPSQGPTPGWIDRTLWPTRRLGVLHAKCLIVAGRDRVHALVTSANLTDGSWCRNLEVAVSWSAPRAPRNASDRRRAAAVADVADGVRALAAETGATTILEHVTMLANELGNATDGEPHIVWSGPLFSRKPLGEVGSADELVAISPFWPGEPSAASRVITAFNKAAPKVTLIGRNVGGGTRLEAPIAIYEAAIAAGCELRVARPPLDPKAVGFSLFRPLHGKQISARSGSAWRSYVGSANGTVQGLGLLGRSNTELGVIVEVGPLLPSAAANGKPIPPAVPDPDDPDAFFGTQAGDEDLGRLDDRFVLARLFEDGRLELHSEPPPPAGSSLEVTPGLPEFTMLQMSDQTINVDQTTVDALIRRPEIALVTPGRPRLSIPILLDEVLKRRVGGSGVSSRAELALDDLLDQLRTNPTRRPEEDQADDSFEESDDDAVPVARKGRAIPRRSVHRAREAIEVVTNAERPLGEFFSSDPPDRLVTLRIGGTGSMVDLARHIAATVDAPAGMSATASAFAVLEVERLLKRLANDHPTFASPMRPLRSEVTSLADALIHSVGERQSSTAGRLRKLRSSR